MKHIRIIMECDKCGELQKPDKEKSDKDWSIFPNVPCKCGGAFKPKMINNKQNNEKDM